MKRIPGWLRWCLLMIASAALAYSQGWTKISLIPLVIFGVVGFARVFSAIMMRVLSRSLARMTPERREKFLRGMSEEKKRKLLAEYGIAQDAPVEKVSEVVESVERFARRIMNQYGDLEFQGDTQAKQILSVYCFGGIGALAIQHGLSQPQAHGVCLAVFTKLFGFEPADAAAKAQAVITAAPDRTSHLYPIIHRGADAFVHWQKHSDDGAAKDFAEVMAQVQKANT